MCETERSRLKDADKIIYKQTFSTSSPDVCPLISLSLHIDIRRMHRARRASFVCEEVSKVRGGGTTDDGDNDGFACLMFFLSWGPAVYIVCWSRDGAHARISA